jgi:hypothetical protein
MKITMMSPLTRKQNTMDLPITQGQVDAWEGGELIQNAMPNLDSDQREFLISGLMKGEFEDMWGLADG